jgi:solute:Na+ symporter, SSS family
MAHFSWLVDGSIVGVYLVVVMIVGIRVRKYVGKVEHFLVAGREMNVFLGIASLAATEFGVVTCMYTAQNGFMHGFAGATPGILMALSMFIVGVTGFCVKPLRKAGVMTIPELFQKQFGTKIRWAAGLVIVLGGLLNMGVFLRVTGEFLVLVTGLDIKYLEIMMTLLLLLGTIYTVVGGLLSVLITDFLQFLVMSVGLIAVTILILINVGWDKLATTVSLHYGQGGFNPFVNKELGWQFVIFNALMNFSVVLTWQTIISRLLAAKDSKTGQRIYTGTSFFFVCRFLIPGIWGIAALAMLSPQTIASLSPDIQQKISLYGMPIYLSSSLPMGLMGLLLAAMLAADMSCTSSYMITWGSVIYNDLMVTLHKGRWPEKRGIFWNRIIVSLIGIFLLFYGLWYPLKSDVWTYLTITSSIYLASISSLLIACCYWKRANNWGAAGAIVLGALAPILYLVLEQVPTTSNFTRNVIGPYISGIAAYALSAAAMIIGSLLKPQSARKNPIEL